MAAEQHVELISSRYSTSERQMLELFLKELNEVKNNGNAEDSNAAKEKFPFNSLSGLQRYLALLGFGQIMKEVVAWKHFKAQQVALK